MEVVSSAFCHLVSDRDDPSIVLGDWVSERDSEKCHAVGKVKCVITAQIDKYR
jgi:hypothetical protein